MPTKKPTLRERLAAAEAEVLDIRQKLQEAFDDHVRMGHAAEVEARDLRQKLKAQELLASPSFARERAELEGRAEEAEHDLQAARDEQRWAEEKLKEAEEKLGAAEDRAEKAEDKIQEERERADEALEKVEKWAKFGPAAASLATCERFHPAGCGCAREGWADAISALTYDDLAEMERFNGGD